MANKGLGIINTAIINVITIVLFFILLIYQIKSHNVNPITLLDQICLLHHPIPKGSILFIQSSCSLIFSPSSLLIFCRFPTSDICLPPSVLSPKPSDLRPPTSDFCLLCPRTLRYAPILPRSLYQIIPRYSLIARVDISKLPPLGKKLRRV